MCPYMHYVYIACTDSASGSAATQNQTSTQPQSSGGLFGSTQKPPSGSLFGAQPPSLQPQGGTQTGGLFGNAQASAQSKPSLL